jgi:CheY-like chemotaxis protein
MIFNPKSVNILPWIQSRNEKNAYAAIKGPPFNPSNILSTDVLNRDPYSILSLISSGNLEKSAEVYAPTNGKSTTSPPNPISSSTNDKRILMVDDDRDIAKFFKLALDHAGFITNVYNDPLSALMNFEKGMYDLLLLDINMPQMSGFELYGKISQIDDGVKVCFVTAFEEYYSEFKSTFPHLNELECYIKKPVGMDNLIQTVKLRLDRN